MSEFRVNSITNQDGSTGPQLCGISTFSGKSGVQIPSGSTEFRRQDGGGRGRGFFHGGRNNPNHYSDINLITIATTGNAVDFGDMSIKRNGPGGNASSSTRALAAGGYSIAASATVNSIDYFIMSSSGGTNDFGDLSEIANSFGGVSNNSRGIFGGFYPSYSGALSFVTIASTGDASDFGSLLDRADVIGGINSPTRGIFSGMSVSPVAEGSASLVSRTEFVSITSLGNSQEFGNLSVTRNAVGGSSSSTRGLVSGGLTPSLSDVIDFCTIATLGDFTDFGNLSVARRSGASCSSSTRGVHGAGTTPTNLNTIDFVTIASAGNATDFGDMTYAARGVAANSDVHGGLAQ